MDCDAVHLVGEEIENTLQTSPLYVFDWNVGFIRHVDVRLPRTASAFTSARSFPLIFAPSSEQEGAVFLVFLAWGFAETIGALFLSKFSDTIGRRALVYVGA